MIEKQKNLKDVIVLSQKFTGMSVGVRDLSGLNFLLNLFLVLLHFILFPFILLMLYLLQE